MMTDEQQIVIKGAYTYAARGCAARCLPIFYDNIHERAVLKLAYSGSVFFTFYLILPYMTSL